MSKSSLFYRPGTFSDKVASLAAKFAAVQNTLIEEAVAINNFLSKQTSNVKELSYQYRNIPISTTVLDTAIQNFNKIITDIDSLSINLIPNSFDEQMLTELREIVTEQMDFTKSYREKLEKTSNNSSQDGDFAECFIANLFIQGEEIERAMNDIAVRYRVLRQPRTDVDVPYGDNQQETDSTVNTARPNSR